MMLREMLLRDAKKIAEKPLSKRYIMVIQRHTAFIFIGLLANFVSGSCPGNLSCSSLANATFSDDFVSVQIQFSFSVKPIQQYYGCQSILQNATISKLGRNPTCSFTSDTTLNVYPDSYGHVKPGDMLIFLNNSIIDGNGTKINIGIVEIQAGSSHELKPVPSISKYGYLSMCAADRFHISADLSLHSGYTQFSSYKWELYGVTGNASASVLNANGYLVNQEANVSEILITSLVSAANTPITLNLTNIFGSTETALIHFSRNTEPVTRVQGGRIVSVTENANYFVNADLSYSNCGATLKKVIYSWNVIDIRQPASNVLERPANSKSLYLKPFLLSRETSYNVTVDMRYEMSDNSSGISTDSVSIQVKKAPLVVVIEGGNRDIGRNQALVLNGKEASGVKGEVSFMWLCKDLLTGEMCKSKSGLPMEFGVWTPLVLAMADGNFTIGRRYQFTLRISLGSESANTSIIVTIKELPIPFVSITSLSQFHGSNDDVVLRGTVHASASNATIQCNWRIFEYHGNRAAVQSQLQSLTTDLTNGSIVYAMIYRIAKNVLRSGYLYDVNLEVTADGRNSKSSMLLRVDMSPRHGNFEVEPKDGTAFNTTFRFRSYGWIASSSKKPLLYRFGYKIGPKTRLLSAWQSTNILGETLLPEGDLQNRYKLTVFVEVMDAYGLAVEKEARVTANAQESGNFEGLIKYYQKCVNEKDYASMSVAINGIINTDLSDEIKRSHVETYLNVIENADATIDLTAIFVYTISDMVNVRTENASLLSEQSKGDIARICAKLSNEFKLSVRYLKTSPLQSLLSIFDGLLQQSKQVSSNATQILEALHKSTKALFWPACRTTLSDNGLNINTSSVSLSSGMEDLSTDFSTSPHFSVSKSYRSKYLHENCMGDDYIKCAGICWSTVVYGKKEHFLMAKDIGSPLTAIYETILIDFHSEKEVNFSTNGRDYLFKLPITGQYNNNNETVKCVMYDPASLSWKGDYCQTDVRQTPGASQMVFCECSRLYVVAGIKVAKQMTTTATPNEPSTTLQPSTITTAISTPEPSSIITIVLDVDCTKYVSDELAKDHFIGNLTKALAITLKISDTRITIWSVACGSLVVNLTIADRGAAQSAEPSKVEAMTSLQSMLASGFMRLTLPDGSYLPAVAPGVQIRTTSPPTTATTAKLYVPDVTTNWMPMMVSFAIILTIVVGVSLFIAWLHGRYYRNKRYTDINSNRAKPKVQDSIETMSKRKRTQQLHKIMDESIESQEVPSIIAPAAVSLKRTRRKQRITPINASTSFHQSSAVSSRTTLQSSVRELPRLALDDTSSESEAETSFSAASQRPKSTKSLRSKGTTRNSAKSAKQGMELQSDSHNNNFLSPSRAKSNYSANGRHSRQSSNSSD